MKFQTVQKNRYVKIALVNGNYVPTEPITEFEESETPVYDADSFEDYIDEECLDDVEFTEVEPGVWEGRDLTLLGDTGMEFIYKIIKH